MCGIIAIAGNKTKDVSNDAIKSMLTTLARRGPDEQAYIRSEKVVLGQTRLSIVDITGGHQPMKDNHLPLTIVFNGEIYGYKETRKKLEDLGHSFTTHSDTEVILKSYAEYGKDCVLHIDGMFAFAIWDDKKQELFVARDRFGKKPFYYTFFDETFYAASEIKALFATGFIKGKIDINALAEYLRLMYIPPHISVYKNISVLPPACAGIVKDGLLKTWNYWTLEKKELSITYQDAKIRIQQLFDEAVKKRMVADVEIGSLLSGGVDSTYVTHCAQKYSKRPLKTFSVGYGKHKDELPFAEEASHKIGTDHHILIAEEIDLKELIGVMRYFDEPHADSSNLPQALVSKLAAEKVKVALSGDGADELFMGYGWYQKHWHTPLPNRVWSTPFKAYKKMTEIFNSTEIKSLVTHTPPSHTYEKTLLCGAKDSIDKINRFDIHIYLPGQLLSKVDRTSMMHSLEVRSPFLDTALAEYVYNLPQKFKLSKNNNKIILKDIVSDIFPREFVNRRKQGFGAPVTAWLCSRSIREKIQDIWSNENHPVFSYIDRNEAMAIKKRAESDVKKEGYKLWTLFCLALWFELHTHNHVN